MADTVRGAMAERRGEQPPAAEDGGGAVLALTDDQTWWSKRQLAALTSLGIKHASPEDLLVFLHYCAKTRLDPFSKQIYLLERRNRRGDDWEYTQTIQVGIDGYRVVAQRAAKREGDYIEYEDTVWIGDDESEHKVWLSAQPPAAARVTIVKHTADGRKLRYPAVARFSSYAAYGKNNKTGETWLQAQWGVMPDHMIEKCAEAFSLRRAYPNDLGGMYVEEELQHEPPPKLQARRRGAEADDDFVVSGTVDSANGDSEAAGDRQAADGDPSGDEDRKRALAKIHATFRRHGLGTKEQEPIRRAIITGLLTPEAAEFPPDFIQLSKLTPQATAAVASALELWIEGQEHSGADVPSQLRIFGERATEGVGRSKAAAGEASTPRDMS